MNCTFLCYIHKKLAIFPEIYYDIEIQKEGVSSF